MPSAEALPPSYDALGKVTFTLTMWDGDDSERLVAVINLDGSSSLDVQELVGTAWQTVWHFEWTALGNGTWASYEGGVLVDSGSWPAGIGIGK